MVVDHLVVDAARRDLLPPPAPLLQLITISTPILLLGGQVRLPLSNTGRLDVFLLVHLHDVVVVVD